MFSDLKWGRIIVAVLFIGIVSWLLTLILVNGYGFYVGFETRGDTTAIQERMGAFAASPGFVIAEFVSLALITLWQARKITRNIDTQAIVHIGIAIVVALLLQLIIGIGPGESSFVMWLVSLVVAAGAGFLGFYLAGGNEQLNSSG